MVRHGKEGLLAQAQPLRFHGGGHHLKGLARAHFMGQEYVVPVKDMGDGVKLVFPQLDFRVDTAENDVLPVILAGAGGIIKVVVFADQGLPPVRVFPYPVPEGVFDGLLFLLGQGGGVLV